MIPALSRWLHAACLLMYGAALTAVLWGLARRRSTPGYAALALASAGVAAQIRPDAHRDEAP